MLKITTKSRSDHRKHRHELVDNAKKKKKKWNRIFIDEKIAIRVIKDYKTTSAHKPRTRLGFK